MECGGGGGGGVTRDGVTAIHKRGAMEMPDDTTQGWKKGAVLTSWNCQRVSRNSGFRFEESHMSCRKLVGG